MSVRLCTSPSFAIAKKAPGEWKTLIITLTNDRISVDLDGQRTTSFDSGSLDLPPRKQWYEPKREPKRPTVGYIGLQNHDPGDVVYFKEVSVRPLGVLALKGFSRPVHAFDVIEMREPS
jgi:hypothetical protein